MIPLSLHPDRLFSSDPAQRDLSRALYATIKQLPIVSPHGHTDPQWYADNEPFTNASALLITPDHYVFRMLYSQGVKLEDLAIPWSAIHSVRELTIRSPRPAVAFVVEASGRRFALWSTPMKSSKMAGLIDPKRWSA